MKNFKTVSAKTCAALSMLLLVTMPAVYADDSWGAETKENDWTGNVSAYLGYKSVDDSDWPDLDSQKSAGVISDFRKKAWPVSIAADLIFAADDHTSGETETTAGTAELHLGARKVFALGNSSFSPYFGGGLAIISASLENESGGVTVDDDETVFGGWIGVGTYYAFSPRFNIGLDVRYSVAEATLFNKKREAGGLNAGITLGYHW